MKLSKVIRYVKKKEDETPDGSAGKMLIHRSWYPGINRWKPQKSIKIIKDSKKKVWEEEVGYLSQATETTYKEQNKIKSLKTKHLRLKLCIIYLS